MSIQKSFVVRNKLWSSIVFEVMLKFLFVSPIKNEVNKLILSNKLRTIYIWIWGDIKFNERGCCSRYVTMINIAIKQGVFVKSKFFILKLIENIQFLFCWKRFIVGILFKPMRDKNSSEKWILFECNLNLCFG